MSISTENLVLRRILLEIHTNQEQVMQQFKDLEKKVTEFMEAQEYEVADSDDDESDESYADTSASSVPSSPQSAPW